MVAILMLCDEKTLYIYVKLIYYCMGAFKNYVDKKGWVGVQFNVK